MVAGLSLRLYLRLVDAVARQVRGGKRSLAAGTRGVFERLGFDADALSGHVVRLIERDRAKMRPAG